METLEHYLQIIAKLEGQVRAWAYHDPDVVRVQAQDVPTGSLSGLPIGLKDIIDTRDMPTCYGSAAYAEHHAQANAWVVERLCAAGAVMMGKTVTAEFAYAHPGPTRNPHDLNHTPGGSSSGSAAAVAAGMVPVALGTQTGGSVIRPSAYCGVVGFKPSFGAISLQGVMPLAPSLDTLGIHSQNVELVRRVFEVLSPGWADRRGTLSKLRVGYYLGPNADQADPESLELLQRVRTKLEQTGLCSVHDFGMPDELAEVVCTAQRHIMAREGSRIHQAVFERCPTLLGPATLELIENGLRMPTGKYQLSLADVATGRLAFGRLMREFDVVLTFSAPGEAPLYDQGMGTSIFNRLWTALGAPCLTLPVGKGQVGLPLGVQLVGAHGDDSRLLDVAALVERLI